MFIIKNNAYNEKMNEKEYKKKNIEKESLEQIPETEMISDYAI
jgi:hypothetical protein